jgi:hypothetical protein
MSKLGTRFGKFWKNEVFQTKGMLVSYALQISARQGCGTINKLECYGFRTGMEPHVARFIISILTAGCGFAAGYGVRASISYYRRALAERSRLTF